MRVDFVFANIKGWPAMAARLVRHDLRAVHNEADVVALAEFRWPWYWRATRRRKTKGWRSYPGWAVGVARPTFAAGAIQWKKRVFEKVDARKRVLHEGRRKMTEKRWVRAVRLRTRSTRLECWFGSAHFVVGGDRADDAWPRKELLREDIRIWSQFVRGLLATGVPVVMGIDANVAFKSEAYELLVKAIRNNGGTIVGVHGVEYVVVFPARDAEFQVLDQWEIPVKDLFTDHEARGVSGRIRPIHPQEEAA